MKPANGTKETKTLYIGNLRYNRDEESLKGQFSKFGKVLWVKVVKTPGTEKSKGIAFMEMAKESQAQMAIKKLDGKVVDGRTLKVSIAKENGEQKTRRPAKAPSFKEMKEDLAPKRRPKKYSSSTSAPFDFKSRFL